MSRIRVKIIRVLPPVDLTDSKMYNEAAMALSRCLRDELPAWMVNISSRSAFRLYGQIDPTDLDIALLAIGEENFGFQPPIRVAVVFPNSHESVVGDFGDALYFKVRELLSVDNWYEHFARLGRSSAPAAVRLNLTSGPNVTRTIGHL